MIFASAPAEELKTEIRMGGVSQSEIFCRGGDHPPVLWENRRGAGTAGAPAPALRSESIIRRAIGHY